MLNLLAAGDPLDHVLPHHIWEPGGFSRRRGAPTPSVCMDQMPLLPSYKM